MQAFTPQNNTINANFVPYLNPAPLTPHLQLPQQSADNYQIQNPQFFRDKAYNTYLYQKYGDQILNKIESSFDSNDNTGNN